MPFEFNMIFQSLDWFLKRKRAAYSNWAATVLAQRRSGPGVLLEAELGLVQPAGPRARRQRGGHGPVLGWCFRLASRPVGLLAFGGGESYAGQAKSVVAGNVVVYARAGSRRGPPVA